MYKKSNFPVNYSVLAPEALVTDVLPGFDIGQVSECLFFSSGFNDTYRIKTDDDRTYFLRAYRRPWRTQGDILYELDVLNHLKQKKFPSARLVSYKDDQHYCVVPAPEGPRTLVLFTEAPGNEITYEPEPEKTATCYGHAVAEMHNALEDFTSPHQRFKKDLKHFLDMPIYNVRPFLRHRPEDWDYFQRFVERLRREIMDLPADELEQGVCHGDLQGYHANVAPDGTLTFFDFDCGGYGYRAYDLAVFLWCCRLEDAVNQRWEPFLEAYQQERQISDLDIRAVSFFVCCRYLWHMGVHSQNTPDWGIGFLNDKYFDEHLSRLHQADRDYLMES